MIIKIERLTGKQLSYLEQLTIDLQFIIHQLYESLEAARDALLAFQIEAGRVSQGGYSTRMTNSEHKLSETVDYINTILAKFKEWKENKKPIEIDSETENQV